MIEARELTKQFVRTLKKGKKEEFFAVDHVSFAAKEGEILGILGPNGAGKTTLLRMLGSLMEPTRGQVVITGNGQQITEKAERKKHIGYLSENTKLYGRFTVRELLALFGELYGFSGEEIEEQLEKTCTLLNMEEFFDNRIEKLSTGQKQRTSIARCLVHNPDIYIFDEPTLGLDIISSKAIIDFMKQEKTRGKSVLYSTHYMEEAEFLCDRIIMIDRGRIIAEGTPKSLKEATETDNLRETFFACMGRRDSE
ncbi:MAG: ATP-binding cassette domain-containing protein [Bacteroidales bacterium]|nr:ATP-binding cassette domain-containing protein [Clostridium sp.]MCM1204191.1 ATP-binding cassette domain-containing protein [Bacteroidales bacterium]